MGQLATDEKTDIFETQSGREQPGRAEGDERTEHTHRYSEGCSWPCDAGNLLHIHLITRRCIANAVL